MNLVNRHIDGWLLTFIITFLLLGLITVSSVSVYPSYADTLRMVKLGTIDEPYNSYYLLKHIKNIAIALFGCFLVAKIPYQLFEKYAKWIFLATLLSLVAVLFIGEELKGAKGWINIPFLPSIQPMEFAKLGFIIFSAYFFKVRSSRIKSLSEGFLPYMFYLFLVLGLLALQPDFGGILLFGPLAFCLYFVAGGRIRYLGMTILSAVFAIASVYLIGASASSDLHYIHKRINTYVADSKDSIENQTIGYQTEQALITIGSGGFGGVGFGKSIQKFGYLPEVEGDFIFSVIVEEWGLFGAFILLLFYFILTYRLLRIASEVTDPFARYVVIGVACWIVLQASTNIGVNLNVIPLTGVTLPLVSVGGSSILALLLALGMVLNISKQRVLYSSKSHHKRARFGIYPKKVYDDRIDF